jgi:hypothetical protein
VAWQDDRTGGVLAGLLHHAGRGTRSVDWCTHTGAVIASNAPPEPMFLLWTLL